MKPLAIWLAGFALLFGSYGGISHAIRSNDPQRVLVVVDSSFPMTDVWDQVAAELDRIDDRRYAEFSLATEKRSIHSWANKLTLGAIDPFAPCGFDEIVAYPAVTEADEVLLITTEGSCERTALPSDWSVVELEP
jgi:hypothetical protein